MAFENGNNAFNYCYNEFQRYVKDNNIFSKALQIMQYFEGRSDYPYCLNDMDFALENVIGVSLSTLANYQAKHIIGNDDYMVWDATDVLLGEPSFEASSQNIIKDLENGENIADGFKREYRAFLTTISPLLDKLFYSESSYIKLAKIINKPTYDEEHVLRFIRNDEAFIDFLILDEDIDKICESLVSLRNNK